MVLAQVTTQIDTIIAVKKDYFSPIQNSALATLQIESLVVNTSGGDTVVSDFVVHVKNSSSVDVLGSPAFGIGMPGTSYSLSAGTYFVTEDSNISYTKIFGGDCDFLGGVTLSAGDNKTCTIINTDIPLPPVYVPSFGGAYYILSLPLINIIKIPNPLSLPKGPGSVIYTYTVTNMGEIPMNGVWVKDNACIPVKFVSGDANNDLLLDVNEVWIYQCTKIVSKFEVNTATAHGQANGWDVYDTANAVIVVGVSKVIPPLIHVMTRPNIFVLPAGGGNVTYNYVVTNPGAVPLSDVSITDDKCTGLPGRVKGHSGDLNKNDLLESNESWSFICKTTLATTTTNIGTAIGHANGLTAVDLSPATVAVSTPRSPNTRFVPDNMQNISTIISMILVAVTAFFLGQKTRKI